MKLPSVNINKLKVQLNNKKPDIEFVAGIACIVAGTIVACKQTTKAQDILNKHQKKVESIHKACEITEEEEYSDTDIKRDICITYAQTGLDFVKTFLPAIALESVGVMLLVGSHNELKSRNLALIGAYEALDKSFREYQKHVANEVGEDKEKDIRYGIKREDIEISEVDDSGKEKTKKIKKAAILENESDMPSPYARYYDSSCKGWERNPEYNLLWLKSQEEAATIKLRCDGFLFLNDVYEMLGIPRTQIGQQVGWIYDKDNPIGDNFVDFGIYNDALYTRVNRNFVNGLDNKALLDFNVDGYILDKI